ncbi:MAG: (2Fe-2S) ferredoxin domain-containing protein [Eubacteriales bacterium]|nr:(2Fe-2S) ferredoxin domain-containing protein [Eubacteriales bacterium]
MKSLKDLEEIRKKTLDSINMRKDEESTRVVIGMATCGIAAGARPVLLAFMDEIGKRNLQHVTVSQTGCIGMCKLEPIVEIFEPNKEKVTYVKMTPEKAVRVVNDHLVNNRIVTEYTIGNYEK